MASRNTNPVRAMEAEVVHIDSQCSIHTDASVLSSTGDGGTWTKTGTGEYTFTLADKYVSLLSATASLQAATAVDLVPQIKSVDVSSAKTVVVKLLAGSTATNPSAACKIHLSLKLKNSTI